MLEKISFTPTPFCSPSHPPPRVKITCADHHDPVFLTHTDLTRLEERDRERGSRNGSRCEEESVMLELLGDGWEYIQTYFSFLNLFVAALADRS